MTAAIDQSWIAAESELPPAGQVVEVWITLARSAGTTWLRGYRAEPEVGGPPRWVNASTGEPFPTGWSVQKWRRVDALAPAPDEHPELFRESA